MSEYEVTYTDIDCQPKIKVLGMGGGGSNAVNRMIELGLDGVDFLVANTDQQALEESLAPVKLQLGPKRTRGLGAGGRPEVGQQAADESRETLKQALAGADMVFLAAGMGGGTGTGSIGIAAEVAKSIGAVTISVVTTPFEFEGKKRAQNAQWGLEALEPHTDTLIVIPNEKLIEVAPKDLPLDLTFRFADDVLRQAVQGIAELVTKPGLINVDFSHIREKMLHGGGALMAIGHGEGEHKAHKAIHQALHHPLLESINLAEANTVIINFSGGDDLSMFDMSEALANLHQHNANNLDVVLGFQNDERLENRVQVIMIVTGLATGKWAGKPISVQTLPSTFDANDEKPIPIALAPLGVTMATDDLDIPAFMRKHSRYNISE